MTTGLECNTKTHSERVAEAAAHQAELLSRPPHPSIAHITPTPESYILAAEYQRSSGSLVAWLSNASMAEGIATVLYEITGHEGERERALLRKASLLRIEAELALIVELRK